MSIAESFYRSMMCIRSGGMIERTKRATRNVMSIACCESRQYVDSVECCGDGFSDQHLGLLFSCFVFSQ